MSIPLPHHTHATGPAKRSSRRVVIDGPSFPASQRDMVAASLLARPDRADHRSGRPLTWPRP
jgi:hypothetical protein